MLYYEEKYYILKSRTNFVDHFKIKWNSLQGIQLKQFIYLFQFFFPFSQLTGSVTTKKSPSLFPLLLGNTRLFCFFSFSISFSFLFLFLFYFFSFSFLFLFFFFSFSISFLFLFLFLFFFFFYFYFIGSLQCLRKTLWQHQIPQHQKSEKNSLHRKYFTFGQDLKCTYYNSPHQKLSKV